MENKIHIFHGVTHSFAVQDRSFNEPVLEARKVVSKPGTQIVQDTNLSLVVEVFNDVASDKSRTAGDEHFHARDAARKPKLIVSVNKPLFMALGEKKLGRIQPCGADTKSSRALLQ
jgi:hypothetical protein